MSPYQVRTGSYSSTKVIRHFTVIAVKISPNAILIFFVSHLLITSQQNSQMDLKENTKSVNSHKIETKIKKIIHDKQ